MSPPCRTRGASSPREVGCPCPLPRAVSPLPVPVCPGPSSREDAAAPVLLSPCLPGPWGQSLCGGDTHPWPSHTVPSAAAAGAVTVGRPVPWPAQAGLFSALRVRGAVCPLSLSGGGGQRWGRVWSFGEALALSAVEGE